MCNDGRLLGCDEMTNENAYKSNGPILLRNLLSQNTVLTRVHQVFVKYLSKIIYLAV